MVVHLGVVILAVAFAASSSYVSQGDFTLRPGETVRIDGHELTYVEPEFLAEDNRTEARALVTVDGAGPYAPALTRFEAQGTTIGTPSVRSTPVDDVQLSLLDAPTEESAEIQLQVTVQPLVVWLWVGGIVMAVGTVLAAFPGRRRRGTEPVSEPVRTGAPDERPTSREPVGVES
ncbi:MAG: cytochrome c-type biogenesis CcmF C-terminal domain-containing protein [Acidimicrobiia bacterium]|nr:cytochrome c-type biogenesis CcmF C-terminal domain-containing protein [Acidimicrobiia bacterium]